MFKGDRQKVLTGEVRLSYVHLLEPWTPEGGEAPKYSATLLIPKTDTATLADIQDAITGAILEAKDKKWGGAAPVSPPVPIHDGDGLRQSGEPFSDECKGHYVMTASTKLPPQVVDKQLKTVVTPGEVYSGVYARVTLRFFGYARNGKKGISCGLNNVMVLGHGEPLTSFSNAESDFGDIAPDAKTPVNPKDILFGL